MPAPRRIASPLLAILLTGLLASDRAGIARAQPGAFVPNTHFELSDTVQVDRADNVVRGNLERAKAYLAARQWSEAIETYRQVMENSGAMLVGVTAQRFISVRDYCHLQLAAAPHEALELYRRRVDPLAQQWYEQGIAGHDRQPLLNVVQQAFASRWGDRALLTLGEMALESGDYAAARGFWEQILPVAAADRAAAQTWLAYPDTQVDLAAVRARLVLVSILEGSTVRARGELAQFAHLHPTAQGPLGGRAVNYAEAMRTMLAESAAWPKPKADPDWPTFAGSPARNREAPEAADVAGVAWRLPLAKLPAAHGDGPAVLTALRWSADSLLPLSFHPLVIGRLALVCNHREIMAVDVRTGKPAWGGERAAIYRDPLEDTLPWSPKPADSLGLPRYTLTVCDGKLYARMGTVVTNRPQEARGVFHPGYLVCLDLDTQGRLLWKAVPEEGWAFEGAPLCASGNVYVAMRRNDIRPQAHVACFGAQTGNLRWRRFVCAAETPARGTLHEVTHNLLTLVRDTIYYNTNLGAVAAVNARDGQIQWVSLYPRDRQGDLARMPSHWDRDLTPCLYDRGTLLVAPADSPRIFGLDAATGQILWQSGLELGDVQHLLGVAHDRLIASGDRLYWIGLKDAGQGRVLHIWPEGNQRLGYGRGILAGGSVYWPTRREIYVFNAKTAQQEKVINLPPRGIGGGNLLFAAGRLLVAGPTELVALNVYAKGSRQTLDRLAAP
jgi:outer membrane protein assembly factor BamB